MDGKKEIGARLRAQREKLGLSQGDVARRLNAAGMETRAETISRYESGKYEPSAGAIAALAGALETTSDMLLGRAPEPHLEAAEETIRADSALIDEVVEELGLEPEFEEHLRRMNWTGGIAPSKGTLLSHAIDMRREARREAPLEPKKPGEKLPSGLTRREPRRGGGRR